MKLNGNQILKATCIISALVSSLIWVVFFIQIFTNSMELSAVDYLIQNPYIITYPLFCIYSIIILLKANTNTGILLFSLFLSLVSQNFASTYFFRLNPEYDLYILSTISFIITSLVFIKALQNFPQQISTGELGRFFPKNKLLRIYLGAFLKNQIWLIFSIFVFALAVVFPRNITMQSSLLVIVLITGILFMYLNFKISSPSSRNKISWLIWGILSFAILSILNSILIYSGSQLDEGIATLIKLLRAFSLFISITMCLFFFDTFNTGVLIQRTIVDGIVFLVIVFLYNTLEHYFLHWMNHQMHISSTLISSILSGFFVLVFSPVHHKFMHVLDERFKKKETTHGDTSDGRNRES